jgi:hypothetical protein
MAGFSARKGRVRLGRTASAVLNACRSPPPTPSPTSPAAAPTEACAEDGTIPAPASPAGDRDSKANGGRDSKPNGGHAGILIGGCAGVVIERSSVTIAVFISLCDTCCNSRGVALFASAYRHWRMQRGFPDPGNLCASCAAIHERIGLRLHAGRGPSKVLPESGDW